MPVFWLLLNSVCTASRISLCLTLSPLVRRLPWTGPRDIPRQITTCSAVQLGGVLAAQELAGISCLWEVVTDCLCITFFHFLPLLNWLLSWVCLVFTLAILSPVLQGWWAEKTAVVCVLSCWPASAHHLCQNFVALPRQVEMWSWGVYMWHLPWIFIEKVRNYLNKYELLPFKTSLKELCCKTQQFIREELFIMNHAWRQSFKSLDVTMTNLLLLQLHVSVLNTGENTSAVRFTTSCHLKVKGRWFSIGLLLQYFFSRCNNQA